MIKKLFLLICMLFSIASTAYAEINTNTMSWYKVNNDNSNISIYISRDDFKYNKEQNIAVCTILLKDKDFNTQMFYRCVINVNAKLMYNIGISFYDMKDNLLWKSDTPELIIIYQNSTGDKIIDIVNKFIFFNNSLVDKC